MKPFLTFLAALIYGMVGADEVQDRYSHEEPDLERLGIERGRINELPGSITYKLLDDNRHQFTIAGLYPFEDDTEPERFESYCSGFFLREMEAEFTVKDCSLTITSTLPISYDWLAWAIGGLGGASGVMPTWFELVARDLPKSQYYQQDLYTISELDHNFPPGLAWIWLDSDTEFRLPFSPWDYSLGTLIVGPTTGSAPAPPRIAIRVLDEDGEVIWKVDNPVEGRIKLAVGDQNEDNSHELYLEVSDPWARRATTRYVVEPRSEQGDDAN